MFARFRQTLRQEDGVSAIETIALTAVVIILMAAALAVFQNGGGNRVAGELNNGVDTQIDRWRGEGSGGLFGRNNNAAGNNGAGGGNRDDQRSDRRTAEEIERDRRRGTEPGGDQRERERGGDLASDWAGRVILDRYLFGGGDWVIRNDPAWKEYMEANGKLRDDMRRRVEGLATELLRSGKTDETIDLTFHQEIENGESISGYQYLHGTNADVGDFQIKGNGKLVPDGDGYRVELDLEYTWNDRIDPNGQYWTDTVKNAIAEAISLGRADPYNIHISWSERTVVKLDRNGNVIGVEGVWP